MNEDVAYKGIQYAKTVITSKWTSETEDGIFSLKLTEY
jgi:hypothetical protein